MLDLCTASTWKAGARGLRIHVQARDRAQGTCLAGSQVQSPAQEETGVGGHFRQHSKFQSSLDYIVKPYKTEQARHGGAHL